MILGPLPVGLVSAAAPPVSPEPASPSVLSFPTGGGTALTNVTLDRAAHVRDARLVMQGGTVPTPTTYRLNASTLAAGRANAWSGGLGLSPPDQPPASYEGLAFNATQVANVSARDGALAMTPINLNFTYQLFTFEVNPLDLVELDVHWVGYGLPPSMPVYYNGKIFLYNFTSLAWDDVAAYPFPSTGVQDVGFNSTHPANYIEPGSSTVVAMVVTEATYAEIYTDTFNVTGIAGVYPKPSVDVGADGSPEWHWDAPGWGALGRQTEFEDGAQSETVDFPEQGANSTYSVLVPRGAGIETSMISVSNVVTSSNESRSGANFTVPIATASEIGIYGLPNNARANGESVDLANVTALDFIADAGASSGAGVIRTGSDPNGWRMAGQSVNVSTSGQLTAISFYVSHIDGNPGALKLSIQGVNSSGYPNGVEVANATVPQSALIDGAWCNFSFASLTVSAGTVLALVVRAPFAPIQTTSNYVELGASSNDSYVRGDGLSFINLTGVGETWSQPAATDLMFQVRVDAPLDSLSASRLRFENVLPSYAQVSGRVSLRYAIGPVNFGGGGYNFTIANNNGFRVGFDWGIEVNFSRLAAHLELAVNDSGVMPWFFDNMTAGRELDLSPALLGVLLKGNETWQGPNGEAFTIARLQVRSSSQGRVVLSSLDIRYSLNLTTPDLSPAFDSYLWSTPANATRTPVPIRIYSPGASSLTLLDAQITYDRPPVYNGFPQTVSDEDVPIIADLQSVFTDDFDASALAYGFNITSGAANVTAVLRGHNLTLTPLANWSGSIVLHANATDSNGMSNASGDVTFTFIAVNDPPWLSVSALDVPWGGPANVDLTPFIRDAESPASTIAIRSVSGAPVPWADRTLTFNFAAGAADLNLTVTLDDGTDQATWPLRIHPREANTPPVLLPIETVVMRSDAAYWLDLRPYASDGETALSALRFNLSAPLTNASGLLWDITTNSTSTYLKLIPRAPAGSHLTVRLTVTDADNNANQTTFGITIVAPPNMPPRIVGVDPAITLDGGPVSIFLATKYADVEDGLAPDRVTWSVESDRPGLFSAEVDARSQTLILTPVEGASGTGTVVLHLVDSGGLEDTKAISIAVRASAVGSDASILVVGLFFGAVVLLSTLVATRNRGPRTPQGPPLQGLSKPEKSRAPAPAKTKGPAQRSPKGAARKRRATGRNSTDEDVGSFLRGLTEAPSQKPPTGDETVASLGVKSGLSAASAPLAAAKVPSAPPAKPAAGRLRELYLFSVKDGGLLFQAPAAGLPVLSSSDENALLQWAFDTVRASLKTPASVNLFDWRGAKVLLARGHAFFLAGRVEGAAFEALQREVKTLVEEVDHNFPGSALDWQRTDVVETVADVLRRLVK